MLTNTETNLDMMKNPDRWPCWPYLPLIKKAGDLGVLLDSDKGKIVVLANLFMLPKSFDQAPHLKYDSCEAIIADGWIVD